MKAWANILLGIWLLASGLNTMIGLTVNHMGTILSVLAIATGVLFLIPEGGGKSSSRIAALLLGLWLIAGGMLALLGINFTHAGTLLAALGFIAGIFVLVRR